MLKEVRSKKILSAEETKEEYQKRMHDNRNKGFTENKLHGKFRKNTKAIAVERSWEWLKMGYMKKETESIITAAQDQALLYQTGSSMQLISRIYHRNAGCAR